MVYWILLIFFIVMAAIALANGIIGIVRYGKMTGAKVTETRGKALPTGIGSFSDRMDDQMDGKRTLWEKSSYATTGKEVSTGFSLSYEEMRQGLKERNPKTMVQFQTFAGFVFFVIFTFAAIGAGVFFAGNFGLAMIFWGVSGLFCFMFFYQMFLGK